MNQGRRHFFVSAGSAVGAAAVVSMLPRVAQAADLPHLAPTDPTAAVLGYSPDTAKVTNSKHTAGAACASCNFFQGGKAPFGPCAMFPGKAVSAKGWCINYVKKA